MGWVILLQSTHIGLLASHTIVWHIEAQRDLENETIIMLEVGT